MRLFKARTVEFPTLIPCYCTWIIFTKAIESSKESYFVRQLATAFRVIPRTAKFRHEQLGNMLFSTMTYAGPKHLQLNVVSFGLAFAFL